MRAEALLAAQPDARVLVLAVFGDDIERCEYSYLFAQYPKRWLRRTGHFSPEANSWVAERIAPAVGPPPGSAEGR